MTVDRESMKSLIKNLSLFLCVFTNAVAAETLYIGSGLRNGDGGIYSCRFADGKLTKPRRLVSLPSDANLEQSPDGRFLYASIRSAASGESGELITFQIEKDGALTEIRRRASGVEHFCSMAASKNGRQLIGASYNDGVVSSFQLKAGETERTASRIELPRFPKGRKKLARAHDVEFSTDGKHAFVPDIFNNRIYVFDVDPKSGALKQSHFVTSDSFQGPRHLILDAGGNTLYLLNQTGSSVVVFRHDGKGGLKELQAISTLPAGYNGRQNHSAEVLLHPNGKTLYISNRIHDSLVAFRIGKDGHLTKIQTISSGGESPWSFVITKDGRHLICSNRKSNNVLVFSINDSSGQLKQLPGEIKVPEPVSLSLR